MKSQVVFHLYIATAGESVKRLFTNPFSGKQSIKYRKKHESCNSNYYNVVRCLMLGWGSIGNKKHRKSVSYGRPLTF